MSTHVLLMENSDVTSTSNHPLSHYPCRGICVDCSGHIFVTQCGSGVECVYVFKPSGEHVATLDQASSGVRMGCPVGIAIDEDGFVYVCDFNSSKNAVVVF